MIHIENTNILGNMIFETSQKFCNISVRGIFSSHPVDKLPSETDGLSIQTADRLLQEADSPAITEQTALQIAEYRTCPVFTMEQTASSS
jgi:hypothetical protein